MYLLFGYMDPLGGLRQKQMQSSMRWTAFRGASYTGDSGRGMYEAPQCLPEPPTPKLHTLNRLFKRLQSPVLAE